MLNLDIFNRTAFHCHKVVIFINLAPVNNLINFLLYRELYVSDIVERNGIEREDIPHNFYDDNGIFHCNLIDFLLSRIELF